VRRLVANYFGRDLRLLLQQAVSREDLPSVEVAAAKLRRSFAGDGELAGELRRLEETDPHADPHADPMAA